MTILERMREENSTIFELELTDKYYLFIEGLTEFSEATDNVDEVKNVLVELHEQDKEFDKEFETSEYIETLDHFAYITIDTDLNDLTLDKVKKHISYILD